MSAIPFALVSSADQSKVFAYGLAIEMASGQDVVTFRRAPDGKTMFSVHRSAAEARQRFSAITPLDLVWEPDRYCCRCGGSSA